MKKIMYNDRYGLTAKAVSGEKTLTGRIEPGLEDAVSVEKVGDSLFLITDVMGRKRSFRPRMKKDETVAISMSYADMGMQHWDPDFFLLRVARTHGVNMEDASSLPGWKNKMFVKSELMHFRQTIANIRVERLADISDEDCLREGIERIGLPDSLDGYGFPETAKNRHLVFSTPKEAFKALIEKTCGKGIWERNPFVVRYEVRNYKKDDTDKAQEQERQ